MELYLKIAGLLLILLAIIHVVFPRRFKWKTELASLSLINRQMMYVHTFFVALMLLLMGALCLSCAGDIVHTPLGRMLALGMFIFWFTRLLFQFFVYSPKLWQGKRFETLMHVLFSLLWIYFSVVFFLIYRGVVA